VLRHCQATVILDDIGYLQQNRDEEVLFTFLADFVNRTPGRPFAERARAAAPG
jgi:hypothetical protein